MLDEYLIIKLTKNILKRYEHNMDNGVMFLFDVETEELWTGNSSSYDLIKLINGQRTLKEIYSTLVPIFEGYDYSELRESFDSLILDLTNKKFLEFV